MIVDEDSRKVPRANPAVKYPTMEDDRRSARDRRRDLDKDGRHDGSLPLKATRLGNVGGATFRSFSIATVLKLAPPSLRASFTRQNDEQSALLRLLVSDKHYVHKTNNKTK